MARAASSVPEPDRTALLSGLTFAAHLRRLFPDFYAEHVARAKRRTTMFHLLGVAGAFLSLAHSQLLALDMDAIVLTAAGYGGYYGARFPFAPKKPENALYPNHAESTCRGMLANDGKAWLQQPVPKVYGLGPDEVTTRRAGHWNRRHIDKHSLALAIWRMLGRTPWAPLDAERVGELAAQECIDEAGGQAIAVLPTIPIATPLAPLCAHLDRTKPSGIKQLGTIIAYVCGTTGNGFADVTPHEARQRYDQVIDLDWERPAAAFAVPRAEQQHAAQLARAYSHLAGRFTRERDLLSQIRAAILEAATAVQDGDPTMYETYDPRALHWRMP